MKILVLFLVLTFVSSCMLIDTGNESCYRIKGDQVYLRYYGGYPRAKEVMLKVDGADAKTFKFIEGSREGACQGGDMFAKDEKHVFYRDEIIKMADLKSFEALKYGYSKDEANVFYLDSFIPKVDAESFFVIENNRKQPYAADKYGLIVRYKRIGGEIDAYSFELLPEPYSRDKNHVYYSGEFHILEGADPATFTCPKFKSIVNFQYYAYDKNRAYYYENGKVEIISGIEHTTFRVLSTHYAKDKNRVYYKDSVMENVDVESFNVPHRIDRRTAQDRNYEYFEGKRVKK